jgi:cytoskeletal protein CcmA (bactofilin family)
MSISNLFYPNPFELYAKKITVDTFEVDTYTAINLSGENITCTGLIDSSDTESGSLQVAGGASIAKNLYVGGDIYGNIQYTGVTAPNFLVTDTTNSTNTTTGSLQCRGGVGISRDLYVGGTIYGNIQTSTTTATNFTVTGTTNSTSTATGSLQCRGGVGIARDLYVGGTIYGNIQTSTTTAPNFLVTDTTNSTSTTTGSLQCRGGVGIAKNAFIGGNVKIEATTTADATTTNTGALYVVGGARIDGGSVLKGYKKFYNQTDNYGETYHFGASYFDAGLTGESSPLNFYTEYPFFEVALGGAWASPPRTNFKLIVINNLVVLQFTEATKSSTTSDKLLTNPVIPLPYRPIRLVWCSIAVKNSNAYTLGSATVETSGIVTFYVGGGDPFTNGQLCGLLNGCITYYID